jgi:hypothetical protein
VAGDARSRQALTPCTAYVFAYDLPWTYRLWRLNPTSAYASGRPPNLTSDAAFTIADQIARAKGAAMTGESTDYERGLEALGSASGALDAANLEHWFFGGWAVDLWAGRLTRPHDDIDVLVWRHDEARVHDALRTAGWLHRPAPDDLVGTNYVRDGYDLQLTFVVPGDGGGVVVPIPDQPIVVSRGPLAFARRDLGGRSVRVLTLEMMLAIKGTPRPDAVGAEKDQADLIVLRSVTPGS